MSSCLTADSPLTVQKRAQIKEEIASGKFKFITLQVLEGVEGIIRKISKSSKLLSDWYTILVVALLTPLTGLIISIILGEKITLLMLGVGIWGVCLGVLVFFTSKQIVTRIFEICIPTIIENILDFDDLDEFRDSISSSFKMKNQILFMIFVSPFVAVVAMSVWMQFSGAFPGFGPLLVVLLISAQCTSGLYGLVVVSYKLFSGTRNYSYRLFPSNPSNSEVIVSFAALINTIIIYSSTVATVATFGLFIFGLINPTSTLVFLLLTTWGPLSIMFVFGHSNISKIILAEKQCCLLDIQKNIIELQHLQDVPAKDTTEHINGLLEYYNKVKASKNSGIDFESKLGLINSFLLPMIPLVLNYLDEIINFLKI